MLLDKETNTFTKKIGEGLFSKTLIRKNDVIATFKGTFINEDESKRRIAAGRGGYMIRFNEDLLLDCYDNCKNRKCIASFANSALHCFDYSRNEKARNRAEIRVDHNQIRNRARLICVQDIEPHLEISTPYNMR